MEKKTSVHLTIIITCRHLRGYQYRNQGIKSFYIVKIKTAIA